MFKNNFNSSFFLLMTSTAIFMTGCSQHKQDFVVHSKTEVVVNIEPSTEPIDFKQEQKKTSLPSNSIWARLLSLYALPEISNARIQRELDWFVKHPKYLARVQQRAEPYLYMILDAVESNQIPGEFALLPIVESAFKAKAYSRSRAAGLWQFLPATGQIFGLKQNWWYDGRRDVYASTQAATLYLKQLGKTFDNDWLLALASYNVGKGYLGRAIRKNKEKNLPADYWSLNLPKETMTYVPRLLALAKIFSHAEEYGIELKTIDNKAIFEIVDIESQLDLHKAAKMAQIKPEQLLELNPGFNRWCTAPNGPHRLLIPLDSVTEFKQNLAKLAKQDRMTWLRHKIKSGESLGVIAEKHNTSVLALRQINQLKNNRIRAGKHLLIPASYQTINKDSLLAASTAPSSKAQNISSYTVQKGDSFWRIAQKLSISSKNLAEWNKLTLSSYLRPGQKLLIKYSKTNTLNTAFQHIKYTVKNGDSLFNISRKFNVTIADLRKWNGETTQKYLQPGQKLKVLVDTAQPST